MKEKVKNKKVLYTIFGIIAICLVAILLTYAYWYLTQTQKGDNLLTTACLDITLSNEINDIGLTNQYPMSNEEGIELTPYEFTITNNCNTSVDYRIILETMSNNDDKSIVSKSAIKVMLDNNLARTLDKYDVVDPTIKGAINANELGIGTLLPKNSITHRLRIWIDENAPISEMNKTFRSKISVIAGQKIVKSYEEGTLAHDILSEYGNINSIQSINPAEISERYKSFENVYYYNDGRSYEFGTEYIYDANKGEYSLGGEIITATLEQCKNGTRTCGKYTNFSWSNFKTICEIVDYKNEKGYAVYNTIGYVTEFNSSSQKNISEIYKTQDDLGISYYLRGDVKNNYVQFGTYAEDTTLTLYDVNNYSPAKEIQVSAGTPMYWRIVRINGDGSIRLIYDGIEKVENGINHEATIGGGFSLFDRIGYTYFDDNTGKETDSLIKDSIDTWYEENLKNTYEEYIEDGIFCNDRSDLKTDENGYITFAGKERLYNTTMPKPTLLCTNKSDRYTINKEFGNGLLTNPVGLITADELYFAGREKYNYMYSGEWFWTMTPYGNDYYPDSYTNFFGNSIGYVGVYSDDYPSTSVVSLRPVINLKANVSFTGNGSIATPYEIVTD